MRTTHTTLAVVIAAVLTLLTPPAAAQSDQALVNMYDRAVARENYTQALRATTTITERHPDAAFWRFNHGAMLARTGDHDAAFEHLATAIDNGFTGVGSFEQSEHLDPIRDDPRFDDLLAKVRAKANERLEDFQSDARRHDPDTYTPSNLSESPGLILALHGTGMRGRDMIDPLTRAADDNDCVLIAPDALRRAADGFSWTYRDEATWFVEHLIERAAEVHNIDPSRVYLVGFSQGANIGVILAQTHPNTFAGVILICGHYEGPVSGTEDANLPPIALIAGQRDPWVTTYRTATRDLKQRGADVSLKIRANAGHQMPSGESGQRELAGAIRWCDMQSD